MRHQKIVDLAGGGEHRRSEERTCSNEESSHGRDRFGGSVVPRIVGIPSRDSLAHTDNDTANLEKVPLRRSIPQRPSETIQILYNMDDSNRRWTSRTSESPPLGSLD